MSEFKSSNSSVFKPMGNLAQGWTVVPNNIMNDVCNIGSDAFLVLCKIFQYINNPNHKISIIGLSTQTGLSKDRVSNAINRLRDLGYIVREPKKRGNLNVGYTYIVYDSPVENTTISRNPEIQDTESQDTDIRDANKENINKKNINKKNKAVVESPAQPIIDLYKSFKLEKRIMPHTINALHKYSHIELEVFNQIFIDASEDKVKSKYRYLVSILEKLESKGIRSFEDYKLDKLSMKKNENVNPVKSKEKTNNFRNFNETFTAYSEDEFEDIVLKSQEAKYK